MTEPEPFLGPRFLRAISLVHVSCDERHRLHDSTPSHLTFRRRHWSQGGSFGEAAEEARGSPTGWFLAEGPDGASCLEMLSVISYPSTWQDLC